MSVFLQVLIVIVAFLVGGFCGASLRHKGALRAASELRKDAASARSELWKQQ
jgi:hypothetical protein